MLRCMCGGEGGGRGGGGGCVLKSQTLLHDEGLCVGQRLKGSQLSALVFTANQLNVFSIKIVECISHAVIHWEGNLKNHI